MLAHSTSRTIMKIIITTQVYNNYGTANDPYWKAKGGGDYVVQLPCDYTDEDVKRKVELAKAVIELHNTPMWWETWLGYHVVEDNILTDFESQQLEWDGRIEFPAEVLNV
jgi:hypothetical protein